LNRFRVRDVSPRFDASLTVVAILVTMFVLYQVGQHLQDVGAQEWATGAWWPRIRFVSFVCVFASLMYGAFVFLWSRLGYYVRMARFDPADHIRDLARTDEGNLPPVTVLVPSYKEDLSTIRQTLLSAALQDYPDRRVVLLVDDPPHPDDPNDLRLLEDARRIPHDLATMLAEPRRKAVKAASAFESRCRQSFDARRELNLVACAHADAAAWFNRQARHANGHGHVDRLFAKLVFERHGVALSAAAARYRSGTGIGTVSRERIRAAYRRLEQQFTVELDAFERKQFENLSHEANKAANLNSYIGLIGGRFRQQRSGAGVRLVPVNDTRAGDMIVPDATYVVTLDADSMLAPEYTRRLVAEMEAPGNEQLAVVQTPYSAIPGAPGTIERIAGATTDIQYIVHQGFTWLGATFWVGANALLRKTALEDIRTITTERGFDIPQFIQDRTVIEDTESSIDLVAQGWELRNVPLRMAYSATPPDFGSLLIQRRRWANGGLLILPKLLKYAAGRRLGGFGLAELVVRIHYLASPALAGFGLLFLLLLPVNQSYLSPWMAAAGGAYFAMYWRDLKNSGYSTGDMLRVYAFNWLLVPINIAGVLKSLQQGMTGEKIPFGRTPKVAGRTAAPAWAVLALWGLVTFTISGATLNAVSGNWFMFGFSLTTAMATGYALVAFVGIRESIEDIRAIGQPRLWRRMTQGQASPEAASSPGAISR